MTEQTEYIDLYDLRHQATGKTQARGAAMPQDCCALVVSFWVRDGAGRLLLEQRAAEKRWFPLYWECGGGSVRAGESAFDAVRREVEEELGFSAPEERWRYLGELDNVETLEGVYFHHWNVSYLVQLDEETPAPRRQREEVADSRWYTVDELDALLEDEAAPVTKYTRRLYRSYRAVLAAPLYTPGQKKPKPPKQKQERQGV